MLILKYIEDKQVIEISLQDRMDLWPDIRSSIIDNAEDILSVGPYSLRLPVWSFLSCRQSLVYVLKKFDIPFQADGRVQEFLRKATQQQFSYKNALVSQSITVDELRERLKQEGFCRKLTVEQERNVIRLAVLPSAATFSVPGAGKTTEALAYFAYRRTNKSKLLVIAPKNAFSAWEEQVRLCFSTPMNIVRMVGGEKKIKTLIKSDPDLLLITYQQLPLVISTLADFLIKKPTFMFLDESHRIKRGPGGQWASSVLRLSHLPISKLIMSGTPLPNSLSDLISQFNFIYPEIDVDETNIRELIKPVFVRTTKAELGLPEVKRIDTYINLSSEQRNLYELLRSEEARQLSSLSSRDRNSIRRIGKSVMLLLQLVSNPALLASENEALPEELFGVLSEGNSPKIEYACIKARKLAQLGKKTIIWSNFVENVEVIASRLRDIGADFIHGGVDTGSETDDDTRERKIARFHQDPESFVLVANPAACAEGISLHTVCHHAIYVDRNYNAAQYLQSEDRIHRLGLPPNTITTIEVLVAPDTIDESVKRRLQAKVKKMAEILDDNSLNIESVDPDLEANGIDPDDISDFMAHLRRS